ncbi:MAG: hypothetical protein HZA78_12860 [Candidatus Schekmanbacteria bacterium]|nr:hypothetical protein [Candidatus Schekmanbacteria bacterium]
MSFTPKRNPGLRLFCVSAALLSYEVLLTRIISAMFVKYFSIVAISMAMMGLGIAGVLVQVYLTNLPEEKQSAYMFWSALILPVSLIFWPFFINIVRVPSYFLQFGDLWILFLFIFVSVLPFFFGGVILALNYHQYSRSISKMYLWDLLGAAFGCLSALILLVRTDGISAVIFTSLLGASATALSYTEKKQRWWGVSILILAHLLAIGNHKTHFLTLPHPGGAKEANLWEKWSEFGITTIAPKTTFTGVGIAPKHLHPLPSRLFKAIRQDYNSLTLAVDGKMGEKDLELFRDQLSNFPLRFVEKPKVLVLGSGGGKEVMAALVCGSPDVTAVEFNRVIAQNVMQGYLQEFSADIYHRPQVKLHVEEARTFLRRNKEKYDVILPVTGTTPRLLAAGCYVFSSEYLQTMEAYRSYLDHLSERGVFCFKVEMSQDKLNTIQPFYRLLATIKEMLAKSGRFPQEHLLVAGGEAQPGMGSDYAMVVLFSPTAFTYNDAQRAEKLAQEMGFELLFSPYSQKNDLLARFLMAESLEPFYQSSAELDIKPVYDDRPYYYHHLKLAADWTLDDLPEYYRLIVVISLIFLAYTIILMILPVLLSSRYNLKSKGLGGNLLALLYFACLGAGFIGLELTCMQKALFILGIPAWGFAVTVSGFTLFMGLGALSAGRTKTAGLKKKLYLWLISTAFVLLLYQLLFPEMADLSTGWGNLTRIGAIFLSFAPLGFLLGMPFVWGIRYLQATGRENVSAWMWAVNSTTSTMGAVGVTWLWLQWGHTATIWTCLGVYLLAALSFSLIPGKVD